MTWLNFHGRGKHLLIDATVVSVYVASMLKNQRFNQPGYAVEQAEARKFSNDVTSRASVAGTHRLVPFAVEESGRFGDHSLRLLREIATRGRRQWLSPPPFLLAFFQEGQACLLLGRHVAARHIPFPSATPDFPCG